MGTFAPAVLKIAKLVNGCVSEYSAASTMVLKICPKNLEWLSQNFLRIKNSFVSGCMSFAVLY